MSINESLSGMAKTLAKDFTLGDLIRMGEEFLEGIAPKEETTPEPPESELISLRRRVAALEMRLDKMQAPTTSSEPVQHIGPVTEAEGRDKQRRAEERARAYFEAEDDRRTPLNVISCDCHGSMFSHDVDCAINISRMRENYPDIAEMLEGRKQDRYGP